MPSTREFGRWSLSGIVVSSTVRRSLFVACTSFSTPCSEQRQIMFRVMSLYKQLNFVDVTNLRGILFFVAS